VKIVYGLVCSSFLLLAAGCVDRAGQKQAAATEKLVTQKSVPVGAGKVEVRALSESFPITGQLTTASDANVGSKVGGRLVSVIVRDGDPVSAGQVIAQVESTNQVLQVQQAQAGVHAARAALNQAIANARVAPSRSKAGVDAAIAQLNAARAQLRKAINGARPEEIAQAEAAVRGARSNMETAKRNRDRQSTLLNQGATSQAAFEQAENAFQGALAQYTQAVEAAKLANNAVRTEDIESAREQVRQAEEGLRTARANQRLDVTLTDQVNGARANLQSAQAQLNLAQQQVADTRIVSPFSGTVYGNPAQPGTVLAPGTPVARIIGSGGVYFEGDVPSGALSQVKSGSTVRVKVDGIEVPLIGTVNTISPTASNVGRLFRARISVPTTTPGLKPGLFARGEITIKEVVGARVVPASAIVKRDGKDVVFVIAGTKVKQVSVERGLAQDGVVQVIGAINPGDEVVIRGVNDLVDGTEIEVKADTARRASGGKPWA
jgi:HlyD family secretion protein